MNCTIQKEKLTGYYDGELDAAERAEVESHIAGCSDCLRELDEIKSASAAVRALTRHSVPKGVTEGILKSLAAPAEPVRMRPRRTAWLGWATSAAAALFVGLNLFYFTTLGKKESVPPGDDQMVLAPQERNQQPPSMEARNQKRTETADTAAEKDSKDDVSVRKDQLKDAQLSKKEEPSETTRPEKMETSKSEGKAETPPKKPAAPGDPAFYTVYSWDVASARERVEKELKSLGITKIEKGAKEFDRTAHAEAQDTCIEVELTEEQIAQLQQRLNRDKKRMTYVPGIQGAEFADEELAKLEEGENRGRFGAREDAPDSKGGIEKKKSAEDPKADSNGPGADKDGGKPMTGGGGGAAKAKESPRKRVVIYFHEFEKKDK